jgi:hypothetical protein
VFGARILVGFVCFGDSSTSCANTGGIVAPTGPFIRLLSVIALSDDESWVVLMKPKSSYLLLSSKQTKELTVAGERGADTLEFLKLKIHSSLLPLSFIFLRN